MKGSYQMNSKTKIINIVGGPGVGKSTIATGIYTQMMQQGISCELASEYAKEVTWDENVKLFENQIHLFAEQFRRLYRLLDKVDYAICDSPLILNGVYLDYFQERIEKKFFDDDYLYFQKQFFNETFDQFNNINFYIERNPKYHTMIGRVHSLANSVEIDKKIKESLLVYDPDYYICKGSSTEIIEAIISTVLKEYSK